MLVFWIRREVPEPDEWHQARAQSGGVHPRIRDLFSVELRSRASLLILVCATSLTAHWGFMFWYQQHLRNLPELASWSAEERSRFVSIAMFVVMVTSIVGNFAAAVLARRIGYRLSIAFLAFGYGVAMVATYYTPRDHGALMVLLPFISLFSGLFALFTMYLPPLFPTLLRTTGAGFCYNIGRVVAAVGTVCFGLFSSVGDYRIALLAAGFLFLPAGLISLFLPDHRDDLDLPLSANLPIAEPAE